MAKVTGWACDQCSKSEQTANANEKPKGWYELKLPGTEVDTDDVRIKDLCTAKCLVAFARERKQAVEPNVDPNNRSDPRVLAAYAESGLSNGERIAMSRRHNSDHGSIEEADEDCIPCQVLYLS